VNGPQPRRQRRHASWHNDLAAALIAFYSTSAFTVTAAAIAAVVVIFTKTAIVVDVAAAPDRAPQKRRQPRRTGGISVECQPWRLGHGHNVARDGEHADDGFLQVSSVSLLLLLRLGCWSAIDAARCSGSGGRAAGAPQRVAAARSSECGGDRRNGA
jgi:heme exporter protein D